MGTIINNQKVPNNFYFFQNIKLIFLSISTLFLLFKTKTANTKIILLNTHIKNKNFNSKYSLFKISYLFFFDKFLIILNYKTLQLTPKLINFYKFKMQQFNIQTNTYHFFTNNFNKYSLYLYGLKSLWQLIKFWIISLFLFILIFYYLTYIRLLPINKVFFEWFLIVMFLYWLISGFVFFYKKYQFSKYTSVIQRFWKRTYILFWIIESGVFLVYFFLTLNASEEPVYMYDQLKLYKNHFFSWRIFIIKLIPVTSLILIGYYLQLFLKWSNFNQQSIFILSLTILLIFIFWIEFYQFFHIINFYGNLNWIFDYDDFTWNLELEFRRTRLANNYISICLIAKFWHLVFIFIFWLFFILRINETKRIRYPLLAANIQNFIILYIMSWLYMYPWFKFIFKNFLENSFFWFMTNNRSLSLRLFFNELKIFINCIFLNIHTLFLQTTKNFTYYYFYFFESSSNLGYVHFKKHALKDFIINAIASN